MKYLDKDLVISGIETNANLKNMTKTLQSEVDNFVGDFKDGTDLVSAWGHHYFCKECGGLLKFDIAKPNDHVCLSCGFNNQSELLNKVWVTNYRNEAVTTIWKSALIYKLTQEQKYLDNVINLMTFYSENYEGFKLHNKEGLEFDSIETMKWGCGRLMPQGLNECIFLIKSINALEILKEDLSAEFKANLYKNMYRPAFEMLKVQVDKIHNISCWKNSAIGVMGLYFSDAEMIDFAFDGEFNIRRQLNEGVTEDYFWYEGSIHYNFFTLEGITNLLLYTKLYEYDFGKEQLIIEKMLESAYKYAFDNHQLPNPNDGWPNVNLKTYSYIYTMAAKVFGDKSDVYNLLQNIEAKKVERGKLPLSRPYYFENAIPLERLILIPTMDKSSAKPIKTGSINFRTSNYGVIKNDTFNVFCKYGHRGPSHAHPDKMNIEVVIKGRSLTRDLSNSGYGAKLCNEWHRVSASHSTVVVNGRNQLSMEQGEVINFDENNLHVKADNVYSFNENIDLKQMKESLNPDEVIKYLVRYLSMSTEEAHAAVNSNKDLSDIVAEVLSKKSRIDYVRKLSIDNENFNDKFVVESKTYNTIDYLFHSEAELLSELSLVNAELGFSENGYQHFKNVKRLVSDKNLITLEWKLGNEIISSSIDLTDKTLYIADSYGNPTTETRKSLIIRARDKCAEFNMTWTINK